MEFPKTIKEFIDDYKFKDTKEIYTNGSELIQVHRVEQALEHYDYENRIAKLEKALDKACKELETQMKAKEMFEELNYEFKESEEFITYSIPLYKKIMFDKERIEILFPLTPVMTLKELKAIYQQCKELGWLESEK